MNYGLTTTPHSPEPLWAEEVVDGGCFSCASLLLAVGNKLH